MAKRNFTNRDMVRRGKAEMCMGSVDVWGC